MLVSKYGTRYLADLKSYQKKNLSQKTIEEFLISDLGKKDFYLDAINIIEKLKLTNSFVS